MNKGDRYFVLNMEKVSFVASAGLRVVLVIVRELRGKRENKGDLHLAALQKNVSKVFEISGLDNVLRIFDDAETASGCFK
jgi:stage II sporulation protein AA (anti-sigma F factor antagonist)